MTFDELTTVRDDLVHLEGDWKAQLSDASIRRSSGILRYLLIDGKLQHVAAFFRKKLKVLVPEAAFPENLEYQSESSFYWPGSETFDSGLVASGFQIIHRALSAEEVKQDYERSVKLRGRSRAVPLATFLDQPSFLFFSRPVSKRAVIKYVCLKLGGVHLDSKRDLPHSIEDARDEQLFHLLDQLQKQVIVGDRNPVYAEIICIVRCLVRSRDIIELRSLLNKEIEKGPTRR